MYKLSNREFFFLYKNLYLSSLIAQILSIFFLYNNIPICVVYSTFLAVICADIFYYMYRNTFFENTLREEYKKISSNIKYAEESIRKKYRSFGLEGERLESIVELFMLNKDIMLKEVSVIKTLVSIGEEINVVYVCAVSCISVFYGLCWFYFLTWLNIFYIILLAPITGLLIILFLSSRVLMHRKHYINGSIVYAVSWNIVICGMLHYFLIS
ncbi:MAG: hypothetical protein KAH32_01465 [Chlamydiia bacterium]|nr:hypothetical protein [Chlamydiia bacterium]